MGGPALRERDGVSRTGRPPVRLLSPNGRLRLCLRPPELVMGPHGMLREVPQSRRMVKFQGGRATCPAEWLEDLLIHPAFTGENHKKIVFLEDDPDATFAVNHGVEVQSGPIGSTTGSKLPAPLPQWNDLPPTAIREALRAGRVRDVNAALVYELTEGRRRATVVDLLHEAALKRPGDEPSGEPEGQGVEFPRSQDEKDAEEVAAALGAANLDTPGARAARVPDDAGTVV